MLNVCSPTWLTQPPTTWPTSSGIDAGRARSPRAARSPSRSAGCTVARPPLRRPSGERAASTMTTSLSAMLRHVDLLGDGPRIVLSAGSLRLVYHCRSCAGNARCMHPCAGRRWCRRLSCSLLLARRATAGAGRRARRRRQVRPTTSSSSTSTTSSSTVAPTTCRDTADRRFRAAARPAGPSLSRPPATTMLLTAVTVRRRRVAATRSSFTFRPTAPNARRGAPSRYSPVRSSRTGVGPAGDVAGQAFVRCGSNRPTATTSTRDSRPTPDRRASRPGTVTSARSSRPATSRASSTWVDRLDRQRRSRRVRPTNPAVSSSSIRP